MHCELTGKIGADDLKIDLVETHIEMVLRRNMTEDPISEELCIFGSQDNIIEKEFFIEECQYCNHDNGNSRTYNMPA